MHVLQYIRDDTDPESCPSSFFDVFNVDNLQNNVGYFRECIINGAFNEVQQYDTYRWGREEKEVDRRGGERGREWKGAGGRGEGR